MRHPGQSDLADRLMLRVAAGDRRALADLFTAESRRIQSIARRIVRRSDLAEEIVQETFVAAWTRAAAFDPQRGSARVWLATIARNRALNMIRDGARMELHEPDVLARLGDRGEDAMRAFHALPERDDLRRCLDTLDAERRRSILLAYVVGLTHGEIAAELKAPLGTVKAWIRRGTIALQECLS